MVLKTRIFMVLLALALAVPHGGAAAAAAS